MSSTTSSYDGDGIQRVLFRGPKVHIYAIPPLTSNKGYMASQWTVNPPMFTARIRVVETARSNAVASTTRRVVDSSEISEESLSVTISLEDPSSGDLFAEAPYNHPTVVTPCTDSARFFAVRVTDGNKKATLGLGFKDRSDAVDFGIALEDASKLLRFASNEAVTASTKATVLEQPRRNFSLKEGETIEVNFGKQNTAVSMQSENSSNANELLDAKFATPFHATLLPPPPSAADAERKIGEEADTQQGLEDSEFGEFQ